MTWCLTRPGRIYACVRRRRRASVRGECRSGGTRELWPTWSPGSPHAATTALVVANRSFARSKPTGTVNRSSVRRSGVGSCRRARFWGWHGSGRLPSITGGTRLLATPWLAHARWPVFRQKTTQVSGCSASGETARISVSALLELADWCRLRCLENQGGDQCEATMATENRLKKGATTSSAEQPLGATARGGPTGNRPNSGRDDGSSDSSSTKEGGIA